MSVKSCNRCHVVKPLTDFYASTSSPDGHKGTCKVCWKLGAKSATRPQAPRPIASSSTPTQRRTSATTVATDSGYVASRSLLNRWHAVRASRIDGDPYPFSLMFLGPSGCGKTVAAEHLAFISNLPFTKVDAAAMTDPESWFGTREIVAVDGVAVTTYRPSAFVQAIQSPGVLLIDEVNRVRDEHRNIIIPLTDSTGQVTNPLTGETVKRHPDCYIIMSGNDGIQFTGTYPIDPALMTRALTERFAYLDAQNEIDVVVRRTHADPAVAQLFVRFANETRTRAQIDPDFTPISTREVLRAASLVSGGLDVDDAAEMAMINGVSQDGGSDSLSYKLKTIWTGIRPTRSASAQYWGAEPPGR